MTTLDRNARQDSGLSAVARLRDSLSVLMAIGGGGVFTELLD
ncbi:MAG: hypothetical protein WBK08_10005 [Nitrospira sp.]